jgi:hypothetical protein
MLHSITWGRFLTATTLLILLYYLIIGTIYFRHPILQRLKKKAGPPILLLLLSASLHAQTADVNNGLNQANTTIRSIFQTATLVMYAIGAILGLVGALVVFSKILQGHREDSAKAAANWFYACIFLVLVATVIQAFFGL